MNMSPQKQQKGMVDIAGKAITKRRAVASASVIFTKRSFADLMHGRSPKGDVFEIARLAGIMAAKNTANLIPMCHPLELTKVRVDFDVHKKTHAVIVIAEVECLGRTGVEMEALTSASVAGLTIYDMMKWSDKGITIKDVKLTHKSGGKSGDYNIR